MWVGMIDPVSCDVDQILDASGLYCPEPVMLLHGAMRELPGGGRLRVIATDPSTERDIPKFCHFLGHQLVASSADGGRYIYLIEKKPAG